MFDNKSALAGAGLFCFKDCCLVLLNACSPVAPVVAGAYSRRCGFAALVLL
jgi:hypothetical protein